MHEEFQTQEYEAFFVVFIILSLCFTQKKYIINGKNIIYEIIKNFVLLLYIYTNFLTLTKFNLNKIYFIKSIQHGQNIIQT